MTPTFLLKNRVVWTREKYPQFFTQHEKKQILTLSCLLQYLNSFIITKKFTSLFHTAWQKPNLDSFIPTTVFELLPFHEKSTRNFSHNMGKTKSWLFHAYYYCIYTPSISREKYPHFYTQHGKNQILTLWCLLLYLNSFHFTRKVPAIFHTTWENTNLDSFMPTTTVFILLPFHEKSTRIFSHNMILYQNWPFLTLLSKKKI